MQPLPSTFGSLKLRDFLKGLVMAVIVPALLAIQQSITAGELVINWKSLGVAAIASFIGYLIKNVFTNDIPVAEAIIAEGQAKVMMKNRETRI